MQLEIAELDFCEINQEKTKLGAAATAISITAIPVSASHRTVKNK